MRSSSTPHVRTFLWPQKPSWTVRLKPRGFYSLSALGGQTLALWGKHPSKGQCVPQLFAGIHHHLLDLTVTLQASNTGGSKDREVRAASDAGMQRDMAGTSHQGHGMGHSPAFHRPLGGQTAGLHYRFSSAGSSPQTKFRNSEKEHFQWSQDTQTGQAPETSMPTKRVLKESSSSTYYFQMLIGVWYLSQMCLKMLVYPILGLAIGSRV